MVNLVSDIGGQAGLWLGASILTLVEILVFVFRMMTIKCRTAFTRKRRRSSAIVIRTVRNPYEMDIDEKPKARESDYSTPPAKPKRSVPDIKVIVNDDEFDDSIAEPKEFRRNKEPPDETERQNQLNALNEKMPTRL